MPATKTATHLLTTSQKYCACHAKRLSTHSRTRLNVTKCHACHAKRSNDTSATPKKDHLCRTSHRHGHTGIARTVADGCERLRTVANGCDRERNVERTHPQPPDPQSETGTLATHSGILKVVHRRKPVRQMAPHITDTPWTPRKSKPLERAPRWVEKGLYH